jgi:hypothetical protein
VKIHEKEFSDSSGSQAENASSILVARSRLDSVATNGQIVANIAVGFRHCSPLFSPVRHFSLSQHCRNATTGSKSHLVSASHRPVSQRSLPHRRGQSETSVPEVEKVQIGTSN